MENRTEPSCHAQRFSQNSEGWTVVKVTRTTGLQSLIHLILSVRRAQLKSCFQV